MSIPLNYGDYNCQFGSIPGASPCPPAQPPAIQLDASQIFYNIVNQYPSRLTCTGLPNGTSLNVILEVLDSKICSTIAPNYASFDLSCLGQKYYIASAQQFAESISKELCLTELNLTSLGNTLQAEITALMFPMVTDPLVPQDSTCACGCEPLEVPCIGIKPTDNLQTVLNKMAAKICSCCTAEAEAIPDLIATNSPTIQFVTAGPHNFNITANAIVSPTAGNILTTLASGLYVPAPAPQVPQVLSIAGQVLSLSGGGGNVTLPTPAAQTLALDCNAQTITISGGNSINLACLLQAIPVTQTPISPVNTSSINITATGSFNTTLSANLNLDNTQPNAAIINSTGLYVPPQVPITVNDTSTLNWTQSGTFGTTLTGAVKVDNTQPNALIITANGLFVAPTPIVGGNTATVQTVVTGNTVLANAIISPAPGNSLIATSQGLYVPAASGNAYTSNNAITQTGTNFQWGGPLIQNTQVSFANAYQVNWVNTPLFNIGDNTNASLVGAATLSVQDNNTANNASTVVNVNGTRVLDDVHSSYSSTNSFLVFNNGALATTLPNTAYSGLSGQLWFNCTGDQTLASDVNSFYSGIYGTVIAPGNHNITGTTISAGLFRGSAVGTGTVASMAGVKITGVGSAPSVFGSPFSGTITNYYGLRIEDLTTAPEQSHVTNGYAIYQAGASDQSIFFGPVKNAGGTTQFTSDERVKENIATFARGLSEINKLNPKTYNYTYNKKTSVTGIIAQEIEQIIPEAVTQQHFETPTGESFEDFRMVDQTVVFYTMLNAIKELSNKVDTLTAELAALQNQTKAS